MSYPKPSAVIPEPSLSKGVLLEMVQRLELTVLCTFLGRGGKYSYPEKELTKFTFSSQ